MRKFVIAAAVVAGMVLGFGSAKADDDKKKKPPQRGPEAMLKKLDGNSDGKLSQDEFKKIAKAGKAGRLKDKPELLDKMFTRLDENKDGFVSQDELKKRGERKKKSKG